MEWGHILVEIAGVTEVTKVLLHVVKRKEDAQLVQHCP